MKSKYYVASVVTVLCIIFSVVFAVKKAESATGEWNSRTSNTTSNLYDIASNGTQVMAVGDQVVLVSSDGSNWTNHGSVGNVIFYGLLHDSTQWIAVGSDSGSGVIYTSPNGSSWTIRHNSGSGKVLNEIASSGSVHVAVGDNGTILRSTDGINWVSQTSGTTTPLRGVAYGNGAFVAVGFVPAAFPVVVLTSADGSSWSDHSAGAGLLNWQGFESVEYLNDRFMASGWYSKIRHSIDNGVTFTTNRTSTEETPAFAYGNPVYFAAGIDRDNGDADIDLASIDGVNWQEVTPSLAVPDDRNRAIFFNDTFITVGNNGSIRQSADCSDNDTDGLCNPVETVTQSYNTGLNLVPFGLSGTGIVMASDLDAAIVAANPGTSVTQIFSWDGINQRYTFPYLNLGGGLLIGDFALQLGASYFVETDGPATLELNGTDYSSYSLYNGLNVFAIPPGRAGAAGIVMASDLDAEIVSSTGLTVTQIFGWDSVNQRYTFPYLNLGGGLIIGDFALDEGIGYFIEVNGDGVYQP